MQPRTRRSMVVPAQKGWGGLVRRSDPVLVIRLEHPYSPNGLHFLLESALSQLNKVLSVKREVNVGLGSVYTLHEP